VHKPQQHAVRISSPLRDPQSTKFLTFLYPWLKHLKKYQILEPSRVYGLIEPLKGRRALVNLVRVFRLVVS